MLRTPTALPPHNCTIQSWSFKLMYPNASIFNGMDAIKRRNEADAGCLNFNVTFAGTCVDVAKAGDLGSRSELD